VGGTVELTSAHGKGTTVEGMVAAEKKGQAA
jgi:hypothetical protein